LTAINAMKHRSGYPSRMEDARLLFCVGNLVRHFPKDASIVSTFYGVNGVSQSKLAAPQTLPVARAPGHELRHHLGLIKTALNIKNSCSPKG
jgi:hypothetical protein